jgi:serine protease
MGDSHRSIDRRAFLRAAGAGAAVAVGGVAAADDGASTGDRLLVGVDGARELADVAGRLPEEVRVRERHERLSTLVVELPARNAYGRLRLARRVAGTSGVQYTEPDAPVRPLGDPRFDGQYAPQQVRAPAAWAHTHGESATIAVVDQGVDYDHPDLRDRFDDVEGRDFVDGDDDPEPDDHREEYHGTHVAGIAAATTDNDEGIAGVSDARLLACRALDSGGGTVGDVARAVVWAAEQGADVINMSIGSREFTHTMRNAVGIAANEGALLVAAAGNDGVEGVSFPAQFSEVVAVSAVDRGEDLADFSNYGSAVDVAAPGVDVLSCWTWGAPYERISGTSMACPVVSGVAALVVGANPALSATELRDVIAESAVDVDLPDREQGAGRVDAANAVAAARRRASDDRRPTPWVSASESVAAVGQPVTFDATDSFDAGGPIERYEWTFPDGTTATGPVVEWAFDSPGERSVHLEITDDEGQTATITPSVGVREDPTLCGNVSETTRESGRLAAGERQVVDHAFRTRVPCRATVSLSGPDEADFDLYLTTDGRRPTSEDYDRRSATPGSDERVHLPDLDGVVRLRALVHARSGAGTYDLAVEELGR